MAETTDIPIKRSSRRRPTSPPSAPEGQEPSAVSQATTVEVPPPPVPIPVVPLASPAVAPETGALAPVNAPAAAAPQPQPAMPPPAPPQPPELAATLPNSPFHLHDVVQVLDRSSRHYGQFFMVGDVVRNKVHGYYLTEGLKKEHITIELQHCWYIGSAKIRSANPCSPKWHADRGGAS